MVDGEREQCRILIREFEMLDEFQEVRRAARFFQNAIHRRFDRGFLFEVYILQPRQRFDRGRDLLLFLHIWRSAEDSRGAQGRHQNPSHNVRMFMKAANYSSNQRGRQRSAELQLCAIRFGAPVSKPACSGNSTHGPVRRPALQASVYALLQSLLCAKNRTTIAADVLPKQIADSYCPHFLGTSESGIGLRRGV